MLGLGLRVKIFDVGLAARGLGLELETRDVSDVIFYYPTGTG